jgi:hypothetical protein
MASKISNMKENNGIKAKYQRGVKMKAIKQAQ